MNETTQNEEPKLTYKRDTELVATIKVCIIAFAFACMSASIAGDVFSIWLSKNMGLDGQKIGELFAMKAMFAIFYKPIFGILLDKFQLKKTFIIIIPILGMLMGPFFQWVYAPLIGNPNTFYLGGILGGIYFGFVIIAGSAAVFNYNDRYIRAHGGTYGKVSAFNAAGWGVMGLVNSILYNIDPDYNFDLASLFGLVILIMILSLRTEIFFHIKSNVVVKETMKIKDSFHLFKDLNFYILLSFVLFCISIDYIQQSQLGRYTASFWTSKADAVRIIGYLAIPLSLTAFCVSIASSRIINYIGVNKGMIIINLIFIAFSLVAGLAGLVHMKGVIIAARFVIQFGAPLFHVVTLAYIAMKFDQKINGTTYLMSVHFGSNIALIAFGPLVGRMFDTSGISYGYIYLALISAAGLLFTMALMHLANKRDAKQASELATAEASS